MGERNCLCTNCFYCEAPVPARHEHDHFPVPKRLKGVSVVTACLHCHDLKDRTKLDQWGEDDFCRAVDEMGRFGRIVYAKMLFTLFEHRARLGIPVLPYGSEERLGIED